MVYNRKASAPWSAQREAGIESATVDSTIEVPQYLQPVVNTGIIDKAGNWKGVRSSDEVFFIDATHEGIPNGAAVLSPQTANRDFIDMTGYSDLFIAIRPTQGGNYAIAAVMGPDTNTFANLTPVDAASTLMGAWMGQNDQSYTFRGLFDDSAQALTANVWNIFNFVNLLKNQKLLQFKIVNNSGGNSDIDFAYLRMV